MYLACFMLGQGAIERGLLLYLQIPDEALQKGASTVREHGGGHTVASQLTLEPQPVSSTCMPSSTNSATRV